MHNDREAEKMGPLARRVQELFDSGFDADDMRAYLDGFTVDCEVDALGVRLEGRSQFESLLKVFRAAFSDNKHTLVASVEEGACVAVELVWTATHTGPLTLGGQTIEATGRSLEWTVCEWDWFADGQIARSHIYADQAALLTQLKGEAR